MSSPGLAGAVAVAAVLLAGAAASAAVAAGPAKPDPWRPGAGPAAAAEAGGFGRTPPGVRRLLVTFADTPAAATARRRLDGLGAVAAVLPEAGVWRITPDDPAAARALALRRAAVTAAEWSLARATSELTRPGPPGPLGPAPAIADPLFASGAQWALAPGGSTWGADLTTALPRPRIAILDSGVDRTHEEWAGQPGALVAPRSTIRGDDNASDQSDTGHGTHVAGIAAAPINGVGTVGVAPAQAGAAEVIPVQIADRFGRSSEETMILGIRHAVRNGAKVINISAGGPGYSRAFQDAILWATQRGALIVASVGNEGADVNALNYPAGYRRVLGVGAQCDAVPSAECPRPYGPARFSNHNRSVDVIAPGVHIISSVPRRGAAGAVNPGYAVKDGTSMAAPFVTGVAALVMAANGGRLSPYQVRRQIINTAIDQPPTGRDDAAGAGAVNARAAVTLAAPADDPHEVNDDIKWLRGTMRLAPPGQPLRIEATVDRDEDPDDVYAIRLRRGERVRIVLTYRAGGMDVYLWGPGARTVETTPANVRRNLMRFAGGPARRKVVVHRAERAGRYFIDVFARRGFGAYSLSVVRGG